MLSLARLSFVLLLCIDATLAWPEGPQARRLVVDLEKRSTVRLPFVQRVSSSKAAASSLAAAASSSSKTTALTTTTASSSTTTPPPQTTSSRTTTSSVAPSTTSTISSTSRPPATTAPPSTTTTTITTTTTSTTTTPACAASYRGGPFTISGTGTLPKPTTFVKRSGQQLTLNGGNFRIAGPNIYWLCQDENSGPAWGYWTDKGRVREALAVAVAMGANTVRLMSCGVSVGSNNPYNLELSNGNWQDVAWDIRDYVIYAAGQYGLRVVLPLTDNYNYYHGGKYSILGFSGASTANKGAAFYTDTNTMNIYKAYITKFLQHTNVYNGKRYADDPTILAWETGNELGGYMNAEMWPPASWTSAIVSAIKAVDGNHLIIDGTNGIWNYTTGATPAGLNVAGIDIVSDHSYPRKTDILSKELGIASAAKKGFLIGEFDWTAAGGGVSLPTYLSAIEQSGSYLGSMMWSVFGHDAQCCNYVTHNDGYSLYYPSGPNSAADQSNALLVVQHFYRLTGRSPPSSLPGVACPQPVF
ncbi:hypothetical protein NBRC10513v2_007421 [Rhodotorula toruloides]